jgi:hypothetical protein
MKIEYKVSLDNITIVGIPKYSAGVIRSMIQKGGIVNHFWQTPHKRYNDNYSLLGGGMLQITHDTGFKDEFNFTIHQIRLEFNPNRIKLYKQLIPLYLDILRWIQEPRITRRDIAIDLLGIDLNDYIILDYASRKRIEYKTGSMVLETLYLGSRYSDERHRFYNKALEQGLLSNRSKTDKETGEKIQTRVKQDLKWWRIEAQLRKEKAEMRKYNAFTKIRVVSKQDFLQHDVRTRAMLFYLQANPHSMQELSVNARSKYKKLLGECSEEFYLDIEGMANEYQEELQGEIESWLNFCPMDVKEGFKVKALESCLRLLPEEFKEEQRKKMEEHLEQWESVNFEDIVSRGTKEDWDEWVNGGLQ